MQNIEFKYLKFVSLQIFCPLKIDQITVGQQLLPLYVATLLKMCLLLFYTSL